MNINPIGQRLFGQRLAKVALILIALLVAGLNKSQARIGETEEQIEARYGKWTDHGVDTPRLAVRSYIHGIFSICVYFLDGKSASEVYDKTDGSVFTDIEIKALLDANQGDGSNKWKASDGNGGKTWTLSDNGNQTIISAATTKNRFVFLTPAFADFTALSDSQKKEEEAKKNGIDAF